MILDEIPCHANNQVCEPGATGTIGPSYLASPPEVELIKVPPEVN